MADSVLQGDGFTVNFSSREITAWGGLALLKQIFYEAKNAVLAPGCTVPGQELNGDQD
ncbi:MAG: hypothetical protein ACOY5G_11090 [Pseudomonadota bacterium]|jgi:hypothetical protein